MNFLMKLGIFLAVMLSSLLGLAESKSDKIYDMFTGKDGITSISFSKSAIKPFEIFKTDRSALIWTVIVMFTVGFANFFSILQPALEGDLPTTLWSVGGPVFFAAVAFIMYWNYERKYLNVK